MRLFFRNNLLQVVGTSTLMMCLTYPIQGLGMASGRPNYSGKRIMISKVNKVGEAFNPLLSMSGKILYISGTIDCSYPACSGLSTSSSDGPPAVALNFGYRTTGSPPSNETLQQIQEVQANLFRECKRNSLLAMVEPDRYKIVLATRTNSPPEPGEINCSIPSLSGQGTAKCIDGTTGTAGLGLMGNYIYFNNGSATETYFSTCEVCDASIGGCPN